jgi:hypothetical protein
MFHLSFAHAALQLADLPKACQPTQERMSRDQDEPCHCPPEEMCPKTEEEIGTVLPGYIETACCDLPYTQSCDVVEFKTLDVEPKVLQCPARREIGPRALTLCKRYKPLQIPGANDPADPWGHTKGLTQGYLDTYVGVINNCNLRVRALAAELKRNPITSPIQSGYEYFTGNGFRNYRLWASIMYDMRFDNCNTGVLAKEVSGLRMRPNYRVQKILIGKPPGIPEIFFRDVGVDHRTVTADTDPAKTIELIDKQVAVAASVWESDDIWDRRMATQAHMTSLMYGNHYSSPSGVGSFNASFYRSRVGDFFAVTSGNDHDKIYDDYYPGDNWFNEYLEYYLDRKSEYPQVEVTKEDRQGVDILPIPEGVPPGPEHYLRYYYKQGYAPYGVPYTETDVAICTQTVTINVCGVLIDNDDTGACSNCLSPDTPVKMANGQSVLIRKVQVGDMVETAAGKQAKVAKVIETDWSELQLYSINDGALKLTADHPVMTTSGWRAIDYNSDHQTAVRRYGLQNVPQLKVGDVMVTDAGNLEVKSIKALPVEKGGKTYNLRLEGGESFYAGGILVKDNGSNQR